MPQRVGHKPSCPTRLSNRDLQARGGFPQKLLLLLSPEAVALGCLAPLLSQAAGGSWGSQAPKAA